MGRWRGLRGRIGKTSVVWRGFKVNFDILKKCRLYEENCRAHEEKLKT